MSSSKELRLRFISFIIVPFLRLELGYPLELPILIVEAGLDQTATFYLAEVKSYVM